MSIQKIAPDEPGILKKPGATSVQLLWRHNAPQARATLTGVTLDPGASQERHSRPGSEQIWVVESGTATMLLADNREIEISAGEVVRTPQGETHGLRNAGPEAFVDLTATTPPQDFTDAYDRS